MNGQELLHIEFSDGAASVYYIDKDAHSKAHRNGGKITLDSFGGTYTFDESTGDVSLFDGVKKIPVGHMIRRWIVTNDGQ